MGKIFFTLLPLLCFLIQFFLSKDIGTLEHFKAHKIVFYADWAFIPANYYAHQTICKLESKKLFWIMFFSIAFTLFMHAFWQYNNMDGGYMITPSMIVLPAGWVHLFFMTISMTVILSITFTKEELRKNSNYVKACYYIALYFFLNYICSLDYVNIFPIICMIFFIYRGFSYYKKSFES